MLLYERLLVEAACERELGKEPMAEQDFTEEIAGPVLLGERGFELLARQQASLDQELAERTPVRVVFGFVERLGHEDPLPRLSARIGYRGIPRRGYALPSSPPRNG